MSDDGQRLQEAQKLFHARKYSECEKELKSLTSDLKVQHNLAIVEYLRHNWDTAETLAALRRGSLERSAGGAVPNGTLSGGQLRGSALASAETHLGPRKLGEVERITLLYEGHEVAYFNEAVLLLHTGCQHEAAKLLRRLLELSGVIATSVLCRALCLLQIVTSPGPALQHAAGGKPGKSGSGAVARLNARSKSDEELIQRVLSENMQKFITDPQQSKMVGVAFADVSTLHEKFKHTIAAGGIEQAIYYNNLGIFAMDDSKWNVAALYFAVAYKASATGCPFLHQSIIHNSGLCALMRDDFHGAITSFFAVQETMKHSALYWVRVAQAALRILQKTADQQARVGYEQMESAFAEQLSSGKAFPNFQLLHIPGTCIERGPLALEKEKGLAVPTAHGPFETAAHTAVLNAMALLVPAGYTTSTAMDAFPSNTSLIQYALLYWVTLETHRRNYDIAVNVGLNLLATHKRSALPSDVHAALISYLVESLTYLNEPDRAMRVLKNLNLSELFTHLDRSDGHQKSRIESLFVNLAIVHIANGSWKQARSMSDSLLSSIYKDEAAAAAAAAAGVAGATTTAPSAAAGGTAAAASTAAGPSAPVDPKSHRGANILRLFIELAQGNQEKALELLPKLTLVPQ